MSLNINTRINEIASDIEKADKPVGIPTLGTEKPVDKGVLYSFDGKADTNSPLRARRAGKVWPTKEQDDFARVFVEHLNARLSLNGYWKLAWTAPVNQKFDSISRLFRNGYPTALLCAWYDKDDDCQFIVGIEDDIEQMLEVGFMYWEQECHTAHEQWVKMLGAVGITESVISVPIH